MKIKSILITLVASILLYSCSMAEGGVRTSNNMEKYAIEYIESNKLLEAGEKISAYYDYTISLDGTEAVFVTNDRLVYHNSETQTTAVNIADIVDIQHREESLIGDIIEVTTKDGELMMIEVAPLNQGETFLKVLKAKVSNL